MTRPNQLEYGQKLRKSSEAYAPAKEGPHSVEVWTLKKNYFHFFSLLYGTPAPRAESQHPEAWPASTFEKGSGQ